MGLKIVALHTDFRIYWPARLCALYGYLQQKGMQLHVIEIAGKGSNYSFAGRRETPPPYWRVLFPELSPEELTGTDIKKQLFRVLDAICPDVILAGAIAFPSGALAVAWGQKRRRHVVIFDDAKNESVIRNVFVTRIKKAVYRGADAMIYPSSDWIPTGHSWGFTDSQMFFGIDVVDNEFWSRTRESNPFGYNYLVAVGRQIPKKNFLTLLKAYLIYVSSTVDEAYRLILVGDGPEHRAMLDFIAENGLAGSVACIPFLSQEKLAAVYQHAQALVCCSNVQETWGLVINEAMACGCPILASNECGAANTLVHHDVNGYRFGCDDVKALAESIIKLQRLSPDEHLKMRNASREIIREWGIPRFCQGVASAIDYVTQQPKRVTSLSDRLIIGTWKGRYRPT